jgi:DNA polymerase-3 subunit delta
VPDFAPVYALVGNEPFLQTRALNDILDQLGPDVQRTDIDGPTAAASDVFDELRSLAMFGGQRVVVVRDADTFVTNHRSLVESYLAEPACENVLILRLPSLPKNQKVYKLIDKVGQIIPCAEMKPHEVSRWLGRHAKDAHGLRLEAEAARLLVDNVGSDLGGLDNELAKLALGVEGGKVTADDVEGGVAFRREQQMWAMTDSVTRGDPVGAVTIWRQLTATDASAEFRAVAWLAGWLEKAVKAATLRSTGRSVADVKRQMRLPSFAKPDAVIESATSVGLKRLRVATDQLAALDYGIKTGGAEARRGVESFLLRLARAAAGR